MECCTPRFRLFQRVAPVRRVDLRGRLLHRGHLLRRRHGGDDKKLKASLHLSLNPLPGGASLGLQASF